MLGGLLDTSIAVLVLKYLYRWHCRIEQRVGDIYRNSQIHRLMTIFGKRIVLSFRFSFLGRITDIRKQRNTEVLNSSKVFQYLSDFYKSWKDRIIDYLSMSKTAGLTKAAKEEFYILPVKAGSIIVIVTIVTNVALSTIWQREISFWGWLMRGLLLFVGTGGLFCKGDLQNIMESSLVLRCVRKLKS